MKLEEEFLNRFENEEDRKILVDFCKSFENRFGKVIDKEEIIKRIGTLQGINGVPRGDKCEAEYSQNGTITINSNLTGSKRKAVLYHELMHLMSMHQPESKPEWIVQRFKIRFGRYK